MGPYCTLKGPHREWTEEERMAYLDWEDAENNRVQNQVKADMAEERASGRFKRIRGMKDIWRTAQRDDEKQQALYEASLLDKERRKARPRK
jgi:hypothetical protein